MEFLLNYFDENATYMIYNVHISRPHREMYVHLDHYTQEPKMGQTRAPRWHEQGRGILFASLLLEPDKWTSKTGNWCQPEKTV